MDTPTIPQIQSLFTFLPMKMEECSETSVYKIQTPGNYPEENIQHKVQLLIQEYKFDLCSVLSARKVTTLHVYDQ
jgi:hypothetical protein